MRRTEQPGPAADLLTSDDNGWRLRLLWAGVAVFGLLLVGSLLSLVLR